MDAGRASASLGFSSARAERRKRHATLAGSIETKGDALSRFDLLAQGSHSERTAHVAELPLGEAKLAVAFTLAAPGESTKVPPLYSYDPGSYLRAYPLRVTELRNQSK
jgi:hypothetical protein